MEDITIQTLSSALASKKISSLELCQELHTKAVTLNTHLNCFISINDHRRIFDRAILADKLRELDFNLDATFGIPIGYKDNICVKDSKTTCASKMLDNFIAPYNATLVSKCAATGFISMGKTNMDEFAMGMANNTSYYGPCKNPWSDKHIPGGSSGGSAAAVAARKVPAAIASDTGGSKRQPAAFCGICGLKPTYGRISRWGMVDFASSLDQAGPMATSAADCAILFDIMSGYDAKDATSLTTAAPTTVPHLNDTIADKVIGVPKELFSQKIDTEIQQVTENYIKELEKLGVKFKEISIPHHEYAVPTYYIISTAECASNLARFDGIRYGYRVDNVENLEELYCKSRSIAFGSEVKRRIMLGNFVLASGYYDEYYHKAQLLRQKITADYNNALQIVDAILAPVTATTAAPTDFAGYNKCDKYLGDQFNVSANLARLPSFAMPIGFSSAGLPIGAQLIGAADKEALLLNIGNIYQQHSDWHKQQPPKATEV